MVAQSIVNAPPAPVPVDQKAVRCDQAVFTSARTPTGQGYRVVAASSGLTPEEKTEISARSPSHGGLCSEAENAHAVAFYGLKSGRLCAALSCTAGREQTGRGGLRIYTRAAVFDGAALAMFEHNPFNIMRAMETQGLGQAELNTPPTLPALVLGMHACKDEDSTARAAETGTRWLAYLLREAIAERPVVLVGNGNQSGALEAVLLGVPATWRGRVSFSRGLKFSIGRPFLLSEISGDTAATERAIRGHAIALVRPSAGDPPRTELGEWERMAADYWSEAAFDELVAFTSQPFADCSREALDRIAALRNEATRASVSDVADLLSLADRRLGQTTPSTIESRLLADLLRTIRMRLAQVWGNATESELEASWPIVRTMMRRSPAASAFAVPLAGMILRRMATYAPIAALQRSLSIATERTVGTIAGDLRSLLCTIETWASSAPPAQIRTAAEVLSQWRLAFPHVEHAGSVWDQLNERLKSP